MGAGELRALCNLAAMTGATANSASSLLKGADEQPDCQQIPDLATLVSH